MNREQQRQNARDQKRIQQRQKARVRGTLSSQPVLGKKLLRPQPNQYPSRPERRSLLPKWWPWAAAAGILVLVVVSFLFLDPFGLRTPLPGKKMPSQGNTHIQPGGTHVVYNTDPPNSGPHFDTVPRRGIYTTPFTEEFLPHFLEHAGVEVTYNSSASADVVKKLTEIVNSELDKGLGYVLMSPRPSAPCQVALTSWQRIQTFGTTDCQPGAVGHDFDPASSKDLQMVRDFIERNQCSYDPENQCGGGSKGKSTFPSPKPGEPTVIAAVATATPGAGATPAQPPAAPTATPKP